MPSSESDPFELTIVGRPKQAKASIWPISRSIGTTSKLAYPQGQTSSSFRVAGERMEVVFASQVCACCPVRSDCTQSQTTGRVLHLRPQAGNFALQARRQEQQTQAFRQQYAPRAGIEATHSQAVRRMGLRRARYDGLDKTHVQHVLTAVAINLVRIDAVLTQTPRGKTRRSHFARLASHPALQDSVAA